MPGKTVTTSVDPSRKAGNAPVASAWHPTAKSATGGAQPSMPHGLVPWPGAAPQSTLQVHRSPPKV